MLRAISCCLPLGKRSKATVAPTPIGVGQSETKSAPILVETSPGRFISVMILTGQNGPSGAVTYEQMKHNVKRESIDGKLNKMSPDTRGKRSIEESSGSDQEKSKRMVVIADVERPRTGDTIVSKISLPPLRSASPVVTVATVAKRGKSRIKWNLRSRRKKATTVQNGVVPKCTPVNSISPSLDNIEYGEKEKTKREGRLKSSQLSQDSWTDEIITLPADPADQAGSNEMNFEKESGCSVKCFTLFFIHGVGGNRSIWSNQMKYFHEIGYTVISMDLIGHGNSSAPKSKSAYTFDSIKSDIFAIFDRFAREKNVIIAHSYGTCFAAMLAREYRTKVSHLVLISSGAPVPLDPNDGAFALPSPILTLLRPALTRSFVKLAFMSDPTSEQVRCSFGDVKTSVLKYVMQGQHWTDCTFLYHQHIRCPTLLIYGSGDGLVSLDEMHEMRKAVPGSVLHVLDDAAHMVMLEQPSNANRLIEAFLKNTAPASSPTDDEPEVEVEYGKTRRASRPLTATSRTIPPSNAFKIRSNESLHITNRAVAVI